MTIESAFDELANLLVLTAGIDDVPGELTPEERPAMTRAVEKRRREFAAGRELARRGLRSFGLEGVSIPVSERRYPVWPDGIVGSISHTRERVGVALARRGDYAAVGLDLEFRNAVTPNLFGSILIDSELRRLSAASGEEEATLIFSCKEAIFKAVNPLSGEFLDFLDVSIELLDGTFVGHCRDSLRSAELIGQARGYFEIKAELVQSVFLVDETMVVPADVDRPRS
jgi:4'-phosphopantetheinyl transferase EntD